jgi:hypothetical protein
MPLTVTCGNSECNKQFQVKDEFAGRRGKCPGCGGVVQVPAAEAKPVVAAAKPVAASAPPKPVVPSKAAPPDPVEDGVFSSAKVAVRAKGFMGIRFAGSAKVTHRIFLPEEKKQPLAVVRQEKIPFSLMGLFGLANPPVRLDIRETESGENLLTLKFMKTAISQLSSKLPAQINIDIEDGGGEPYGRFEFRGGLYSNKAEMKVVDGDGNDLAEVKRLSSSADGIGLALVDPKGRTLGTVRTEAMDDVAEVMKTGKAKMSFSAGGAEGHVAEIDPGRLGKPLAHRLVVALAVIVEATGIGKKDTGSAPMGPPRRGRR